MIVHSVYHRIGVPTAYGTIEHIQIYFKKMIVVYASALEAKL